jgi:hypothetical protein
MNVTFAKADLARHVLWMCPHWWQDQFNLHKKGMTPVDMCLVLLSLKAIELVCGMVHTWVGHKVTPINLIVRQYTYLKVMFWYFFTYDK